SFRATPPPAISTLSLHDALPILKVAEYARQHPEVRDEKIVRPIFIMGMPRTGTTLASYLLGGDPNLRSLLRWEVATPVPPATTRSEEHTSELQSRENLVCRLLLE